jgi:SAM-dependent methyltransferase
MHPEAWNWLAAQVQPQLQHAAHVIDLGGRDVNGTPRALFSAATDYRVVDAQAAPGVHIVADARSWLPAPELRAAFDVALCTEVFEHVQHWQAIVYNLWLLLRPGGCVLVTCATAPRRPHAIDGREPPPAHEWYANVEPTALRAPMELLFREVKLQTHPRGDLYARARR